MTPPLTTINRRPPKSLSDSCLMPSAALPAESAMPASEELAPPVFALPTADAIKVTVPSLDVVVESAPKLKPVPLPVDALVPAGLALVPDELVFVPEEPVLIPPSPCEPADAVVMPPTSPLALADASLFDELMADRPLADRLLAAMPLADMPSAAEPPAPDKLAIVERTLPEVLVIEEAARVASNAVAFPAACTTE